MQGLHINALSEMLGCCVIVGGRSLCPSVQTEDYMAVAHRLLCSTHYNPASADHTCVLRAQAGAHMRLAPGHTLISPRRGT